MNTHPFSTRLAARVARAMIVLSSFAIPALLAWLASEDFRDFAGDNPHVLVLVPLATTVLTQVMGQLAGKGATGRKPSDA